MLLAHCLRLLFLYLLEHFSTKDTKVPTLISVFAIVIDIAFSWIFSSVNKKQ